MGEGAKVFCEHCGFESTILEGSGFLYPSLIKELKERAIHGEFGDKLKAVIEANPDGMINGENILYVCGKCGNWYSEPKLSYYIPTVKDAYFEDSHTTKRLYTHRHRCEKCNSVMHMHNTNEGEALELNCPECGSRLRVSEMDIDWD
ncbi:MAG: hypothetical protein IK026_00135 [Eubacteriaceae bacterium]|nr:hypothetical protein [Eubacteriaceae bacterium]